VGQQLGDDPHDLLGRLAGPVHRLGHALAQRAVMIHERVADIGEGEAAQRGNGVVGAGAPGRHVVEERSQRGFVHRFTSSQMIGRSPPCAEVTRRAARVLA
jgi:hypothetical protein